MNFPEMEFNGLTPSERIKWRSMLCCLLNSLTEKEREIIPKICFHTSMVKALYHTFNPDGDYIDDVAGDFFDKSVKIWAFSYLDMSKLRNPDIPKKDFQRIVLAVKRRKNGASDNLTPEFTIFHEVGHFFIQEVKKIHLYKANANYIEYLADEFAVIAYIRLLHKNPNYMTISTSKKQIEWEKGLKQAFKRHVKSNNRIDYEKIAKKMMEEVQWKDVYHLT